MNFRSPSRRRLRLRPHRSSDCARVTAIATSTLHNVDANQVAYSCSLLQRFTISFYTLSLRQLREPRSMYYIISSFSKLIEVLCTMWATEGRLLVAFVYAHVIPIRINVDCNQSSQCVIGDYNIWMSYLMNI